MRENHSVSDQARRYEPSRTMQLKERHDGHVCDEKNDLCDTKRVLRQISGFICRIKVLATYNPPHAEAGPRTRA